MLGPRHLDQRTKIYYSSLVQIGQPNPPTGRWNVFAYSAPVLTTDTYPDDLDTSTLALLILDISEEVKHKTMDDMLQNTNPDGLVYVRDISATVTKVLRMVVLLRPEPAAC